MVFLAGSCEGDWEIEKNTHNPRLCGGEQMWSEIALPSACHHIKVKHKANNRY